MATQEEVKTVTLAVADVERLVKIARAARVSDRIDLVGPHDDVVVRRAESALLRARSLAYANAVALR
jgi:hypothetical protein